MPPGTSGKPAASHREPVPLLVNVLTYQTLLLVNVLKYNTLLLVNVLIPDYSTGLFPQTRPFYWLMSSDQTLLLVNVLRPDSSTG